MDEKNPFYRPEKPKNSLELLKWTIFEPELLVKYKKTLSYKEGIVVFLKAYPLIILILVICYLMTSAGIVAFDLPSKYPKTFKSEIVKEWKTSNDAISKCKIYLKKTYLDLIFGLTGLSFGLTGLSFGLTGGLAFGVAYGLIGGLILGLIGATTKYIVILLVSFELPFGLIGGLTFELFFERVVAEITVRRLLKFANDQKIEIIGWLIFMPVLAVALLLFIYLLWFRVLPFYLFHAMTIFFQLDLIHNPYLRDSLIILPIPTVKQKILLHSWKDPNLAFQFVDFLLEYRSLQRKLAFEIIHTATAATWYHHPLFAENFIIPRIYKEDKKAKQLLPSEEWFKLIEKAKSELIAAEIHNHRGFKKDAWQIFHQTLQELEKSTLLIAGEWKHDYLKAIRRWLEESEKRLKSLELELQTLESVTRNKYRVGESLKPDEFGRETFLGREDSKNELSFRILASGIMPTFLLQGQRRIGKTSLLNFLPELLGSRFAVIVQDMQSGEFRSISDCLTGFVRRAGLMLKCQISDTELSDDPLTAWQEFEAFFKDSACREERKIILAFDEYENFHKLLKQEGETGERLLAAMRSFSQHQNHVVLLFTGLMLFSDLGKPDFSEYFVHALRLKVDYLKKEDSIKLITQPYPEFRLIYPDELAEEMYRLTVGHPALLQHICFEMVNRANILQKRNMNNEDLQTVLELVLDRQNMVMSNFWRQFCNGTLKETVREIMRGTTPQQKADLLRLLDYGFIIEDKEKPYKLRVPLFEQWIEKHGESFDYPTYSEP